MGATESQKTEKRPVVFLFTQRLKTYKDHNALRNRERINSPADAARSETILKQEVERWLEWGYQTFLLCVT